MLHEVLKTLRKELEPLSQGRTGEYVLLDHDEVGSHSTNAGSCIPDPDKIA